MVERLNGAVFFQGMREGKQEQEKEQEKEKEKEKEKRIARNDKTASRREAATFHNLPPESPVYDGYNFSNPLRFLFPWLQP